MLSTRAAYDCRVTDEPSVLLELHSADRLVRTLVMEEMARRGLRPNLFAILALIELHQPVTPSELALETGVRPTTLRDMINEMVDNGHVRRVENPADRRSHFLEVTGEGRQFIQEAGEAMAAVERRLADALGEPLESLRDPLARLRRVARDALTFD
jgi:DNA-binding MarR family transcriptional regulator